mmetsp:Transcript_31443/g.100259  ORF Transcript_31443/g.100259 Transcript_31443/m.100259 type:complete len:216 (+) Transcript_31443:328-975(+)
MVPRAGALCRGHRVLDECAELVQAVPSHLHRLSRAPDFVPHAVLVGKGLLPPQARRAEGGHAGRLQDSSFHDPRCSPRDHVPEVSSPAAVAFELPGVLSIVAVFALVVASGRPNCTCPDLQGNAWIMAGVTVAFWLVHLWHMTWKFGGTPTTPMLEIIRLVLAMSLFAAGASLSITISELGTFQRIDDFSGSAWTRADLPEAQDLPLCVQSNTML